MNFWRAVGRFLMRAGAALAPVLRDIGIDIMRAGGRSMARIVEHTAPWVVGLLIFWGMVKFAPDVLANIAVLAVMFFGLWVIVRAVFPKKKKS